MKRIFTSSLCLFLNRKNIGFLLLFHGFMVSAQSFTIYPKNPFSLTSVIPSKSAPAFADLDGDGDWDMLSGSYDGNYHYYKNIGTINSPIFDTVSVNPFSLTYDSYFSSPAFADLDGDGDSDLLVGGSWGHFAYYKNIGTATAPNFDLPVADPFSLSSATGDHATPAFADLDGDGDLDMLAGSNESSFAYYKNIGTSTAPIFDVMESNPFLLFSSLFNNAPSFVDIDGDGDLDMMAGGSDLHFHFYRNIGTVNAPIFELPVTNPFSLTYQGSQLVTPTFVDLDGDGDLDLMSGRTGGEFYYYMNNGTLDIEDMTENSMNVYPNPNDGIFRVKVKDEIIKTLELTDIFGELIYKKVGNQSAEEVIDLSALPKGIYFLKICGKEKVYTERIIIAQ